MFRILDLFPSSGQFREISTQLTEKVPTMVHHIQRRCVCGLSPSSGILNYYKTERLGNWIYFRFQEKRGRLLLCWVL
jgi:hypothetical protein